MSGRSSIDEHTEALKTNTAVIGVAAAAHTIQQERLIRAQKAQNELAVQQLELERRKYEEEERRNQAIATVRRYRKAKALLSNADAVAPDVIFNDVPELGEARSKYRWRIFRKLGKFVLAPFMIFLLIGIVLAPFIEKSDQAKQLAQAGKVAVSNVPTQQLESPRKTLPSPEAQNISAPETATAPIQGQYAV